jgi:hypothetical protein
MDNEVMDRFGRFDTTAALCSTSVINDTYK